MAQGLEQQGANLLVIPCNTANVFLPQIADTIQIPLVNWPHEAAIGLRSRRSSVRRIGLLATTGTIASNLYQKAFASLGQEIATPCSTHQQEVMDIIYGSQGVKAGYITPQQAHHLMRIIDTCLKPTGADALLLACTELSLLFALHPFQSDLPVFDATQLVAERVVLLAGGKLKNPARAEISSPSRYDIRDESKYLNKEEYTDGFQPVAKEQSLVCCSRKD
jgi:aspartate racemase